jgi:glyoxylase-like metal-dependent hydrolase (beta-lactamase superfamily II)
MGDLDRLTSTRRTLLAGAAAGLACTALPRVASAKAPMANTQAPGFYRFKVGSFEATVVSDGPLHMGAPAAGVFSDVSKEQMLKELNDNFLPTDEVLMEQNALVINTGERVILFDTGVGTAKAFGPDSGRLLLGLKSAGFDPKDVDAIVLTHAHPDHCWGLMADDAATTFQRPDLHGAVRPRLLDRRRQAHAPATQGFIAGTRKHLLPNRDRIVLVRDGQEFLPGIRPWQHRATPSGTRSMSSSQGKSLCNAGDIAHHHDNGREPTAWFAYDTDGKQAVASRLACSTCWRRSASPR